MTDYTPDTTPIKRCSRCGEEFPATLEYFNRRKGSKDGLRGYCRKCHVRYAAEWSKANPEQAAQNARNGSNNYRKRNRDAVLARTREWKSKNQSVIKQYMDRWKTENDPRLRAERISRRAEVRGLASDFIADDWRFALSYFEGNCAACNRPLYGLFHTVAADHWIPLSDPTCPGTVPSNIVPLCCGKDGCNESKGNNNPEQWVIAKFGHVHGREILAKIQDFFSAARDST
jgi:hypothetical protein